MEPTIIHKQQLKKRKQEADRLRPLVEKWLKREYRDLVGPLCYALARGADDQREAEAGDLSGRAQVVYEAMLAMQAEGWQSLQLGQIQGRVFRKHEISIHPRTLNRDLHALADKGLVIQFERERAWLAVRVDVDEKEAPHLTLLAA